MNNEKIKVLFILDHPLMDYRIPFFNSLNDLFDITIITFQDNSSINYTFSTLIVKRVKLGPFYTFQHNFYKLIKNYDIIINMFNIRFIWTYLLLFMNKITIQWGIGLATKPTFDSGRLDLIRYLIIKNSNALITYSSYAAKKYIKLGIQASKIYVANNTVYAIKKDIKEQSKEYFIFIGALNKRKGIFELLYAYEKYKTLSNDPKNLIIIGIGEESKRIQEWIASKNLSNSILLKGYISDNDKKASYLTNSIACISPNQAGLSVLESMAYGVPFITKSNSITGGERLNITNNVNGILYNSNEALDHILLKFDDTLFAKALSISAYNHYWSKCTLNHMTNAFREAILNNQADRQY